MQKMYKNNTSNIRGVSYNSKYKRWTAHITLDGRIIKSSYSENVYRQHAKQHAIDWRKNAEDHLKRRKEGNVINLPV